MKGERIQELVERFPFFEQTPRLLIGPGARIGADMEDSSHCEQRGIKGQNASVYWQRVRRLKVGIV